MVTAPLRKRRKKLKTERMWKGIINWEPHVTIILGKKGSGKTQLFLKLLLDQNGYCGRYDKIYFFSPTFRVQFRKTWSILNKKGIIVYEDVTAELLQKIIDGHEPDGEDQVLVCFDDVGDSLKKIDSTVVSRFISNSRHARVSAVFLSQKLTYLPTLIRNDADVYISFAAISYLGVEALWREVSIVDKKTFMEIFREATEEQYSFLCCCTIGGKTALYKNCKDLITQGDKKKK